MKMTVRDRAIALLKECHDRGDHVKDVLKALSRVMDMGVPAARQARNFLIRSGHAPGEVY